MLISHLVPCTFLLKRYFTFQGVWLAAEMACLKGILFRCPGGGELATTIAPGPIERFNHFESPKALHELYLVVG